MAETTAWVRPLLHYRIFWGLYCALLVTDKPQVDTYDGAWREHLATTSHNKLTVCRGKQCKVCNREHACTHDQDVVSELLHFPSYPGVFQPAMRTVSSAGIPHQICRKLPIVAHGALPRSAINSVNFGSGAPKARTYTRCNL
jgi:hypothetical protein